MKTERIINVYETLSLKKETDLSSTAAQDWFKYTLKKQWNEKASDKE